MTRTPPGPLGPSAASHDATLDASPLISGRLRPSEWFESIYSAAAAANDPSLLPWADLRPNPMMIAWLNAQAPGLVRPGARVVVVGCGLGDDVALLNGRGYDATGFDASAAAIAWARRRFPDLSPALAVADLLDLPARWRHRFDLVVEIYTLQSLPPALREDAARAVCSLCSQRGTVLAIARGRDESDLLEHVAGPPWPLTFSELSGLMELGGMRPLGPVEDFCDDMAPPVRRLRGAFSR